ncbi:MAG: malyl-CoA/(S)-citramalyl-CoA lyase [Thermomicrobiales bacterium]|jgi:citrate lyase subunit beta/citryl-CoA lyase|nr:malyl-CoA/(S)-citramalyl-CoA lyase [Thermomicrobiales bacterium]MEA2597069.1 malyl-CoA/(S)-citramalyl-CoA lyase [Thermomicrobiales bacterium]
MRTERSELAVPASNPRMIDKALASDADVAFLDLEDAVAPSEKPHARAHVIAALRDKDWKGKPGAYRINALDSPFCYRDLIEVVEAAGDRLDFVVVPKVNRPEDVHVVATLLGQIEQSVGIDRRIGIEVQIETAEGLINCERIAAASPRVEAIIFGPGDYAASVAMPLTQIGVPDEWDDSYPGHRWHYPMSRLLVAGRAAGIRVVDGPFADFRDEEGFRRSCRVARALGFDGKWCIHPAQIAIANEVFSPSAAELAWAQKVLDTYAAATASGLGAIAIDGKMIDAASIRMAERTLAIRTVGATT